MSEAVYRGSCYCGAVEVVVAGEPAAGAICHCRSCRKWHAAPINAWAIWPGDKVAISGETVRSDHSPASGRISCSKCGGCVANHKPARDMMVIYPMTLTGSGLQYQPAFHIFYDERVMDMADGLKKFADMPEAFGGSGRLVDEPAASRWSGCGSNS
ncbi:MAG: GFA family protein [Pseudomonadota bacterium]